MKIPSSIRLGGIDFDVAQLPQSDPSLGENTLGRISWDKHWILLDENMRTITTRSTLIHELVHGLLMFTGDHDLPGFDENFVTRFGNVLDMLLANNPDLLKMYVNRKRT